VLYYWCSVGCLVVVGGVACGHALASREVTPVVSRKSERKVSLSTAVDSPHTTKLSVNGWMDGEWKKDSLVCANKKRLEGTGFVCGRLEEWMVIEWQLLG
jgi:hypothetical protein